MKKSNRCKVPSSVDQICATYRDPVRRHLSRIVPSAEAEDLTQEVLAKIAAGFAGYRGEASVATWVFRIATRTALDHLRSRRHRESQRTESLSDVNETVDEIGGDESTIPNGTARQVIDRDEMGQCLREYVGHLPESYAEILALSEFEELSNAEVAKRLGISLAAGKIRLHRARAALKVEIESGCDLYRTSDNILACDRIHPCGCRG